jgi:hypothetical protein
VLLPLLHPGPNVEVPDLNLLRLLLPIPSVAISTVVVIIIVIIVSSSASVPARRRAVLVASSARLIRVVRGIVVVPGSTPSVTVAITVVGTTWATWAVILVVGIIIVVTPRAGSTLALHAGGDRLGTVLDCRRRRSTPSPTWWRIIIVVWWGITISVSPRPSRRWCIVVGTPGHHAFRRRVVSAGPALTVVVGQIVVVGGRSARHPIPGGISGSLMSLALVTLVAVA